MKKLLLSLSFLLYSSLGFSQLVEGFENTPGISGPLPATWTLGSGNWTVFEYNTPVTVGTNQSWGINPFTATMQYEGNQCASVSIENIGAGNTSEDYLVTPAVTIPTDGEFRFYTRMLTPGNQGTIYKLMIAPEFVSPSEITAYTLVQQWTENDLIVPASNYDVWTEKVVDLSDYAGVGIDVYIAFVRVHTQTDANINGDRWLIDNVGIASSVPCILSTTASLTSLTTVDLSWTTTIPTPVEVMILPCDQPAPSETDSGVIVTGNSYQFTNLLPNICYRVYLRGTCPGSNYWRIKNINQRSIYLKAFIDINNNGIMDTGEEYFNYGSYIVSVNNANPYSYRTSSLTLNPQNNTDVFDFGYQLDSYYGSCFTVGSFNYNDIAATPQVQTFYFPVVPIIPCFDNKVELGGSSIGVRPDSSTRSYLSIKTNGLTGPTTGTVTYTKAPNTSIIPATSSPGIVLTPTGFTYNYSGLTVNHPVTLGIRYSVPAIPTVNLGDILTSNASISFSPADSNPANNTSSASRTVMSSYDPNDINESHGPQIQFDQFSQNDYLTYTIRFQNTGNANAIRVRVDNVLHSRIDENSIEMIAARHDYIMVRRDNTVSWEFNNIQLPPASVNEDLSNGFITFRVKLKPGFAIGDIIPATASIYFDSNPAIVTETFNTEFVEQLGNPTFNSGSVSLYPNPAKATVQITQTGNEGIEQVAFFDVTGKLVKRISNIINSQEAIDISTLAKGIYFVEITNTADMKTVKKLIIQ
jgi:hypothetical protein